MSYASTVLCTAFVFGIVLGDTAGFKSVFLALAVCLPEWGIRRKIPVISLFIVIGILLSVNNYRATENNVSALAFLDDTKISAAGHVVQPPRKMHNKTVVLIKTGKLERGNFSTKRPLLLDVTFYNQQNFKTGDFLNFQGTFKKVEKSDAYRFRRHIDGIVSVGNGLSSSPPESPIYRFSQAANSRTKKIANSYMENKSRALFSGMLFGDISEMDEEQQIEFRRAGLTHIVAVSGSNLALIVVPVIYMLSWLKLRKVFQMAIILVIIVLYAFATGLEPPILRALVMTVAALTGLFFVGQKNSLSFLSVACFILLAWDPFLVSNPAFLLSFSSTLGLILLMPSLMRVLSLIPGWLSVPFATTLSAQIFVIPVAAYFFGEISLASFFANVLAAPLVPVITNFGMLSVISFDIIQPLSLASAYISELNIKMLLSISRTFGNFRWSIVQVSFTPVLYLIYFAVVFMFFSKHLNRKAKIKTALFFILIFAAYTVWKPLVVPVQPKYEFEAYFFDVGQADGALVRSKDGIDIVIDTGKSTNNAMLNHLKSKKIKKIDLLVLSHFDEDHAGGTANIAKNYKISYAIMPENDKTGKAVTYVEAKCKKALTQNKTKIIFAKQGQNLKLGGIKMNVLHPSVKFTDQNPNNNSIVLRVSYGENSVLFTGDIENEAQEFLKDDAAIKSDVLKIPHHGAANAANEVFLRQVSPRIAVISVGKYNTYGHPSRKYLNLLQKKNISVYRTDLQGTIKVVSDGKIVSVIDNK